MSKGLKMNDEKWSMRRTALFLATFFIIAWWMIFKVVEFIGSFF